MYKLKDEEGNIKNQNKDIKQVVTNFYQKLFYLEPHNPEKRSDILESIQRTITKEENKLLERNIEESEVWEAIKSLSDNKSPGIDGLPIELYKLIWPEIKKEMTEILNHFLNLGILSNTQRTALVTLIHKGGEKQDLKNWRPISLLCTDYKILAKIIANRFKEILPKIISKEQTGGIKDRKITQNLNTYRNFIEYFAANYNPYNKNPNKEQQSHQIQHGAAIISLDFEKAYDRVDLGFLKQVLTNFGFGEKTLFFIEMLYHNAESQFLVNGELSEGVKQNRGVRQGCPLSMFLYIIYIEPFLRDLKNQIQPTFIAKSKYLISAFVDDVAILLNNEEDFIKLEKCIRNFEEATNSKINKIKTQTLGIGYWKHRKEFPLKWLISKSSIKILGIEWFNNLEETINNNVTKIITKMKSSIEATFNRNLTIQQKSIYFNCFVFPKIGYLAKILPIPKKFTDEIQKLGYNFIWRHKLESLAENELYTSRKQGGLNLINVNYKTKALLAKTILEEIFDKDNNCNNKIILTYWIGIKMRNIILINPNEPHCESTPKFLINIVQDIQYLNTKLALNSNTNTKELYKTLVQNVTKEPKIVTKNPNTNFKQSFTAITKPFLSEHLKEHLFQQIHNILPTKDRLLKCRRPVNPNCDNCEKNETLFHLFECETTKPATSFMQRKIANLYEGKFNPTIKEILLFQFPPPTSKRNKAIWLSANLSLILWKKRKKPNFMNHFITSLKTKEENLRKHLYYEKWFGKENTT